MSTPGESLVLPVADKVYSLALSPTKIIVAMGARQNWIYDIATIKTALENKVTDGKQVEVWQKRESSLKFMTRTVKAMPNDQGKRLESGGRQVRCCILTSCHVFSRLYNNFDRGTSGSRVL